MTADAAAAEAVEGFAEKVLGDYAGANALFMAAIGVRLGLFEGVANGGPTTSELLAGKTGLDERYLREWLSGMYAAGYLAYDRETARYSMPSEHVPVLAEEFGPFWFGGAFYDFSTWLGETYHGVLRAFREGGGIDQRTHGEDAREAIDRFTAPWFENLLVSEWLPAMPDVVTRLESGASLCDIGCGSGRALVKLAQAFPSSTFVGYDVYAPAVEVATRRAKEAGVDGRARFEVRDVSTGLPQRFDVVTTFDVIHDSADPQGIVRAIHAGLQPGGRYICVDINCSEKVEENVGPVATVFYGASLAYGLNVSLAEGGTGLGTLGLPHSKLTELATTAGFTAVRKLPIEDPFNSIYELTP